MEVKLRGNLIWTCPVCNWDNIHQVQNLTRFHLADSLENLECRFCKTDYPSIPLVGGEDYEG